MEELQNATEIIETVKARLSSLNLNMSSDVADGRSLEQIKAECFNSIDGKLNEKDGYNCPICRNRGLVADLKAIDDTIKVIFKECRCMSTRYTIARMKQSGRAEVIKKYTFANFKTDNPFQKTLKASAQAYVKAGKDWFFMGGQSGCGKSHIGTAIFREFLLAGKTAQYMAWREDSARLKKLLGQEGGAYGDEMEKYKTAAVLYVDDLFKTGKASGSKMQQPTAADINLAFEILNYRANHPELLTIISTECTMPQLVEIDEAIAGRIAENAKPYVLSIAPDRSKNYRLQDVMEL